MNSFDEWTRSLSIGDLPTWAVTCLAVLALTWFVQSLVFRARTRRIQARLRTVEVSLALLEAERQQRMVERSKEQAGSRPKALDTPPRGA